jgi:subtilisin family serine protease
MAPKARWIGCRNMRQGVGTPASYTACFEFFLAPYPQGGDPFSEGRPDLAPHIINNSWACPPSEGCDPDTLQQVVEVTRAAGQLVVASAGNKGSGCESVVDPIAIYDASFSVGAHNATGSIAPFSSRGPVTIDGSGRLKPDIIAPGVNVYSTYPTDRGGYAVLSGTSMASPHVAGAVALLWSAVPDLIGDIERTEQVLIKSATPAPAESCGESADAVPNYTYGYGYLNALAAVELAQNPITVTVTVAHWNDSPVSNAHVFITDQLTGYIYAAVSDGNGTVVFSHLYAGDYLVQASANGALFADTEMQLSEADQEPLLLVGTLPFYLPWTPRE